MDRLYFDYNASAPLSAGLEQVVLECLKADYKNPSSGHQDGQKARAVLESSRKTILRLLDASSYKLAFTSGGTEANNQVIFSAYRHRGQRNQIIATEIEHASVYNLVSELGKKDIEVLWVKVSRTGEIDLDDFKKKLSDQVFLVSVMLANNETGFVLPVREMAELAHQYQISVHTDAVCATGKWPIRIKDLNVDYYTFSSHKFGGFKGVGGVIYKNNAELDSLLTGGSQESARRSGTENLMGIVSSAFALEAMCNQVEQKLEHERRIRKQFYEGLKKIYDKVSVNESKTNLPQTLNVSFPGLDGNLILTGLDLEGVSVSFGSACASGSHEVSRVLKVIEADPESAASAIRFSFGAETTSEQIKDLLTRIQKVIVRMSAQ